MRKEQGLPPAGGEAPLKDPRARDLNLPLFTMFHMRMPLRDAATPTLRPPTLFQVLAAAGALSQVLAGYSNQMMDAPSPRTGDDPGGVVSVISHNLALQGI